MQVFRVFAVLVAVALVLASTASAGSWNRVGRAPRQVPVRAILMLPSQNVELYQAHLLKVADPDSPVYGQWMTRDQILDMTAPPAAVSKRVEMWARAASRGCALTKIENRRDSVVLEGSAECMEKILGVELHQYQHVRLGKTVVRRLFDGKRYSIPSEVVYVAGLDVFPPVRPRKVLREEVPQDETFNYIYPDAVRRVYGIPEGSKTTNSKSSQSVVEFLPEGAPMLSDLYQFFQQIQEPLTNITHIVGEWEVGNNGESVLDIEYLAAIGANADTWYITIDGWVLEMATELFHMPNAPHVHSISYGWMEELTCESDVTGANCTGLTSQQYVQLANTELSKVTGLGMSLLVATQDEGAPSDQNEDCSLDSTQPVWSIYPASSPWVTAVSATTLYDEPPMEDAVAQAPRQSATATKGASVPPICNQGYTCDTTGSYELPCMVNNTYYQWTTGGGFASYAPMPAYQSSAVSAFLSHPNLYPPTQFFVNTNRGYADVSAFGDRILTIQSGAVAVTAGTSAATPIYAGVVTLWNDARFNANKSPLGFLNPMLYKAAVAHPTGFRRVTQGDNRCSIGVCCTYGYYNYPGVWNPVNGLGSPAYDSMLSYINSLP